ncbi:MAG: sensor histidine kinase [Nitratireductor sp.]
MNNKVLSFRTIGYLLIIFSMLGGAFAGWTWLKSNTDWRSYQSTAYTAGILLYNAMQNKTSPSNDVIIKNLSVLDQQNALAGDFRQITIAPKAAQITNVPISRDQGDSQTSMPLSLIIYSPTLTYQLANLPHRSGQTAAETTGEIFKLIATYCSDPVVIARMGDNHWVQIDGSSVWSCHVAPKDNRLFAAMALIIVFGALTTTIVNLSGHFTSFAEKLRTRRHVGGPDSYDAAGPQELQNIVSAVNTYLETERTQLKNRAAVLSGVSHDLGTPATRLRLRTALISDLELRQKLEQDIDSMTGMIESVLTYTRAEMSTEAPRRLSITSLIDSIVADYQDTGRAVKYKKTDDLIVQGGRSLFMSKQGQGFITGEREVVVNARPISLERAITNLVENALKYGRRATLSLKTDANTTTIIVEDEGSNKSANEIEELMAPFQRGDNTKTIDGYGLGLTIVATIAKMHGGSLSFEDTNIGLAAHLKISRN